eukprot:2839332-Amphidinium_carterae.1
MARCAASKVEALCHCAFPAGANVVAQQNQQTSEVCGILLRFLDGAQNLINVKFETQIEALLRKV